MNLDFPVLDQILLGAGALFDAKRSPVASRLTVFPPAGQALDAAGLGAVIEAAWPAEAGPLLLAIADEAGLLAVAAALPPANVWLEVPAFLLADAGLSASLAACAAAGRTLVLQGGAPATLAAETRALFRYAVVDPAQAGAALPAGAGGKPLGRLVHHAHNAAEAGAAIKAGAVGTINWPLGDVPARDAKQKAVPAGVQTVVDLMQRVDREEPAERLEAVVRNDPSLAFRLMRYINSPGFGLSVEISSFRHALMILGYQRLKRWLALLVTSAIDDPDIKPLMFMAVRRGLLMEELARPSGDDTLRNELFICGVFSLLDRMLAQPFDKLLKTIPVPGSVQQALVDDEGPCAPFLALAQAVEIESQYDIREMAEKLMLSHGQVNRALLQSLANARSLTAA
jgi:EAL and modified HD-GYP domain-containing signal transduction protein